MSRSQSVSERFNVLLVEDDAADVRLTREALEECKTPYHLHVARDGLQALEYLKRIKASPDIPRPDVILLDWNLPGMDGREVLRAIKSDEELRNIPVLVLTTSSATSDVRQAYDLHANCFITKPVNIHRFFEIIGEVERFWVHTATLPR
jgi:two-component system, chemotaxis family, response regulator Rcp1